jgi:hypothetical protein
MSGKREKTNEEMTIELLKDLLITELGRAEVPQLEIRKIVGCDIVKVNRIVKHHQSEENSEMIDRNTRDGLDERMETSPG